jgi:toxin ParE1/3/4
MSYKLEIRPLAYVETIEAYDWYESQREGLGLEFLESLQRFYERLLRTPENHSYYEKPVRQGKMERFPFIVVYEFIDPVIVIYSVFMTKQSPEKKRTL